MPVQVELAISGGAIVVHGHRQFVAGLSLVVEHVAQQLRSKLLADVFARSQDHVLFVCRHIRKSIGPDVVISPAQPSFVRKGWFTQRAFGCASIVDLDQRHLVAIGCQLHVDITTR